MLLRAALALAAKNIAVFPCAPGQKTPACPHGHLEATTDVVAINAWWHENPAYNLAIATGSKSGIFVVDTDGVDAEAALIALGELPKTVTVLTAKGRHRYFKLPPNLKMSCSVRKLAPGVGIDIRANGGFAVCPPSRHPDGPVYKWAKGTRTFADPPHQAEIIVNWLQMEMDHTAPIRMPTLNKLKGWRNIRGLVLTHEMPDWTASLDHRPR